MRGRKPGPSDLGTKTQEKNTARKTGRSRKPSRTICKRFSEEFPNAELLKRHSVNKCAENCQELVMAKANDGKKKQSKKSGTKTFNDSGSKNKATATENIITIVIDDESNDDSSTKAMDLKNDEPMMIFNVKNEAEERSRELLLDPSQQIENDMDNMDQESVDLNLKWEIEDHAEESGIIADVVPNENTPLQPNEQNHENDQTDDDSSSQEPMMTSIRGNTTFIRQTITGQRQVDIKNENCDDADEETNQDENTPNQSKEQNHENINNVSSNSIPTVQAEPSSSQTIRNQLPSGTDDTDANINNKSRATAPCGGRNCQDQEKMEEMVNIQVTLQMTANTFAQVAPIIFGAVTEPPQIVVNQNAEENGMGDIQDDELG